MTTRPNPTIFRAFSDKTHLSILVCVCVCCPHFFLHVDSPRHVQLNMSLYALNRSLCIWAGGFLCPRIVERPCETNPFTLRFTASRFSYVLIGSLPMGHHNVSGLYVCTTVLPDSRSTDVTQMVSSLAMATEVEYGSYLVFPGKSEPS